MMAYVSETLSVMLGPFLLGTILVVLWGFGIGRVDVPRVHKVISAIGFVVLTLVCIGMSQTFQRVAYLSERVVVPDAVSFAVTVGPMAAFVVLHGLGWWLGNVMLNRAYAKQIRLIDEFDNDDLLELVEQVVSYPVISQSPWVTNRWTPMSHEQRQMWIGFHAYALREFIKNHGGDVDEETAFIGIQQIDRRGQQRKNSPMDFVATR